MIRKYDCPKLSLFLRRKPASYIFNKYGRESLNFCHSISSCCYPCYFSTIGNERYCKELRMDGVKDYVENAWSRITDDPYAMDLQITLFMSALNNYRHDSLLRPFPSFFLNENDEKNIKHLKTIAIEIPSVEELSKKKSEIADDAWQLIDWITDVKNFKLQQVPVEVKFEEITSKTENSKSYHKPSHIFEVKYEESANRRFNHLAGNMSIIYGYHGSRVENFHSILHNGLHAHLNKVSAFGEGTYLSSDVNVSILYSKFGEGWKNSLFGKKLSCIAVCEIIDHPDVKRCIQGRGQHSRARANNSLCGDVPEKYFIVTNNQLIRVKYIMVYSSYSNCKTGYYHSLWIFQHPVASLVIFYTLFLLLLGLSRSNTF